MNGLGGGVQRALTLIWRLVDESVWYLRDLWTRE